MVQREQDFQGEQDSTSNEAGDMPSGGGIPDWLVQGVAGIGEGFLHNLSPAFHFARPSIDMDAWPGVELGVPFVASGARHYDPDGDGFVDTISIGQMPFTGFAAVEIERRFEDGWTTEAESTDAGFLVERLDGWERTKSFGGHEGDGHAVSNFRGVDGDGQTVEMEGVLALRGNLDSLKDDAGLHARLDHLGVVEPGIVVDDLGALLEGPAEVVEAEVTSGRRADGTPYVEVRAFPEAPGEHGIGGAHGTRLKYADGVATQTLEPSEFAGLAVDMPPAALHQFEPAEKDGLGEGSRFDDSDFGSDEEKFDLTPGLGIHPSHPRPVDGEAVDLDDYGMNPAYATEGETPAPVGGTDVQPATGAAPDPGAPAPGSSDDDISPGPRVPFGDAAPVPPDALGLLDGLQQTMAGAVTDQDLGAAAGTIGIAGALDGTRGGGLDTAADVLGDLGALDIALDTGDDWAAAAAASHLAVEVGDATGLESAGLGGVGDTLGGIASVARLDDAIASDDYTGALQGISAATGLAGSALSSTALTSASSTLGGFVPYAGMANGLAAGDPVGTMIGAVTAVNPVAGIALQIGAGVLGGLFGDDEPPPPPEAWAELGVDGHGYFGVANAGDAHGGNGGGMAVAVQRAADTLNAVLESSGGQWLDPGVFESMRLGYDGDGVHVNGRSVDSIADAVERLVLDQLDGAVIEGGDIHVRRAVHGDRDDLDALIDAVSMARQYSAVQDDIASIEALADDPAIAAELHAFERGELEAGDLSSTAAHVRDARALVAEVEAFGLEQPHSLDHASRLNAAFDAAGIDLAGVAVTDLVVALEGGRLTVAIADPERPDAAIRELDHAGLDWHAQSPDAAMLYLDDGSGIVLADLLERTGAADATGAVHVGEALAAHYGAEGPGDLRLGTAGSDTLTAGDGGNVLAGLGGENHLFGGSGDDIFVASAGGDTLTGGAGHDTVDYGASDAGVRVDLATGEGRGGLAAGDTYRGVEAATGSTGDDVLVGSDDDNRLEGNGGDDVLSGGGGDNTLLGDGGNDLLLGGNGRDRIVGGDGDDVLDGGGGGNNALLGGDGNDTLIGHGNGDLLRGGAGMDAAVYEGKLGDWSISRHGESVFLEHSDGSGGRDRLLDIESVRFEDVEVDLAGRDEQDDHTDAAAIGSAATRHAAQRDARTGTHWGDAAAIGLAAAGVGSHAHALEDTGVPLSASGETWPGSPPASVEVAATDLAAGAGTGASSPIAVRPVVHLDDLGASDGGGAGGPPAIEPSVPLPPSASAAMSIDAAPGRTEIDAAHVDHANIVEGDTPAQSMDDQAPAEAGSTDTRPIFGTSGDDVLVVPWAGSPVFGLAGDDLIVSDARGLYIDGGAGFDTVSYVHSPAAVAITLDGSIGQGGYAEHDRLTGIERVYGSHHDDRIVSGLERGVELHGIGGDNVLVGGGGDDVLYGGDGNDVLHAGAGDNELYGGAGDNVFHSGPGHDLMLGGEGNDTFHINADDDLAFIDGAGGTNSVHIGGGNGVAMDLGIAGNIHRVSATEGDDVLTVPVDAQSVDAGGGHDRVRLPAGLDDFAVTVDHDARKTVLERIDGSVLTVRSEEIELADFARPIHADGRNNAPYARDVLLGEGLEDTAYAFSSADLLANDVDFDRGDRLTLDSVAGIDLDLTRGLAETYWTIGRDEVAGDNLVVDDSGNDSLVIGTGDNLVVGDGPREAAVFEGRHDEFKIDAENDRLVVDHIDGDLGVNTLYGVQTLTFTDRSLHIGEAAARHGVVRVDGDDFLFEPAANVNRGNYEGGADGLPPRPGVSPPGFEYRVRDDHGAHDRANAVIDIEPVNDAPLLGSGQASYEGWFRSASITSPDYSSDHRLGNSGTRHSYWEAEGSGRVLGVDVEDTGNAIGGVNSDLTYRLVSAPENGRLSLDSNTGEFQYSLNQGADAAGFTSTTTTTCGTRGHCTTDTTYTLVPEQDDVDKSAARSLSFGVKIVDSDGESSGVHEIDLQNERPGGGGGKKPLALDLEGNGLDFVDTDDSEIVADINGDGAEDVMAWIAEGTGLLTIDRDGSGHVSGFDEISFVEDHPDAETDLEGLALAFDSNADGILDAADEHWEQFAVWHDIDGDGVEETGERLGVEETGIVAISLEREGGIQEQGDVTLFGTGDFQWANGDIGTFGDVAFHFRPLEEASHPGTTSDEPVVAESGEPPPPSIDELAAMAAHAAVGARAAARDRDGLPADSESGPAPMMVAAMEDEASALEISSVGG